MKNNASVSQELSIGEAKVLEGMRELHLRVTLKGSVVNGLWYLKVILQVRNQEGFF